MTSPLSATVRPAADGARIVLSGRIDRDADAAMADAYGEARATGSGPITLDFAATDYINSTGIALIVRLLAEARRDNRAVRAMGLSEHYREIFRITRLSDFMTLDDDSTVDEPGHNGGAK
ncbi:MAG TPA: STAS domain-containing protein [Candidatus Limnocylindrales bacterium]|nr:STAS domain-containing protein [Candidatus Limnocylindrales bacterium]